ncbi:hypothetical protein LCGC14_1648240 [marine sediment metagenome]|uniref:Uncharacterized protein n=1 Tax=marine sediment metagenome TaxID=412755 RepID=A0A0F9KDG0_9ZZZZ
MPDKKLGIPSAAEIKRILKFITAIRETAPEVEEITFGDFKITFSPTNPEEDIDMKRVTGEGRFKPKNQFEEYAGTELPWSRNS